MEETRLSLENQYRQAVESAKGLAVRDAAMQPDYAAACNTLAQFLRDEGRLEEAEHFYCDALDIYRQLEKTNPAAFGPFVARTCRHLGRLLSGSERVTAAEWFYREALDTWKKLSERGVPSHSAEVSALCNDLAVLIADTGRPEETERLYRLALNARRKLAKKNPLYVPEAAQTCFYYALFALREKNDRAQSKALFLEALSLYEKDARCHSDAERVRRALKRYFPEEDRQQEDAST